MEKRLIVVSISVVSILAIALFAPQVMAAEFHVTNATELQNALSVAANNGEDDIIYLAAGTYQGCFSYRPPASEHMSLIIMGESGTTAQDIITESPPGSPGWVWDLYDQTSGALAYIILGGITVQNGWGGIFASTDKYDVVIFNCIIRNNIGVSWGGGIFIDMANSFTLQNSLVLDNGVTQSSGYSQGGGVYMRSYFGDCTAINNIIARNKAEGSNSEGGGFWVSTYHGDVYLLGNTIYSNQATKGGGTCLSLVNIANAYNNIIYGNTATEGNDIYISNVTTSNGYNNNYSDMFGAWTDSGLNLNTDPLFVDPANSDFHLQSSSPMIDAGTYSVPDPPGIPGVYWLDFEGNQRNFIPDIGAYEYSPVKPFYGTVGTVFTITGSGFGTSKGKVRIGNMAPKILAWNDSSIQCQFVKCPPADAYPVIVQPKGGAPITVEHGYFMVALPTIVSIEPSSGSANDEIAIYGNHFGTKKGKVTIGGKNCKVLVWWMDSATGESKIVIVVPKRLAPGTYEIKVINSVGDHTRNFDIE